MFFFTFGDLTGETWRNNVTITALVTPSSTINSTEAAQLDGFFFYCCIHRIFKLCSTRPEYMLTLQHAHTIICSRIIRVSFEYH